MPPPPYSEKPPASVSPPATPAGRPVAEAGSPIYQARPLSSSPPAPKAGLPFPSNNPYNPSSAAPQAGGPSTNPFNRYSAAPQADRPVYQARPPLFSSNQYPLAPANINAARPRPALPPTFRQSEAVPRSLPVGTVSTHHAIPSTAVVLQPISANGSPGIPQKDLKGDVDIKNQEETKKLIDQLNEETLKDKPDFVKARALYMELLEKEGLTEKQKEEKTEFGKSLKLLLDKVNASPEMHDVKWIQVVGDLVNLKDGSEYNIDSLKKLKNELEANPEKYGAFASSIIENCEKGIKERAGNLIDKLEGEKLMPRKNFVNIRNLYMELPKQEDLTEKQKAKQKEFGDLLKLLLDDINASPRYYSVSWRHVIGDLAGKNPNIDSLKKLKNDLEVNPQKYGVLASGMIPNCDRGIKEEEEKSNFFEKVSKFEKLLNPSTEEYKSLQKEHARIKIKTGHGDSKESLDEAMQRADAVMKQQKEQTQN